MVGRTYWLGAVPVVVRARWNGPKGSPRNVLLELPDGSLTVRPFRGLRREKKLSREALRSCEPSSILISGMTKQELNTITGRAIAHRLRGKGHTGARLERAIDEVRDQLHCEADRGSQTVAALHCVWLSGADGTERAWRAVVKAAKESLAVAP